MFDRRRRSRGGAVGGAAHVGAVRRRAHRQDSRPDGAAADGRPAPLLPAATAAQVRQVPQVALLPGPPVPIYPQL